MPGSFHSLSESKVAPMLVTGSYVGWLLEIAGKYLQAGRLEEWCITPYLMPADGELDVVAESDCGRLIVAEVKKQKTAIGKNLVEDFAEKVESYAENFPGKKILPAFLSLK
jgi:hypothetical protein